MRQFLWVMVAALLIYGAWQLIRALLAGRRVRAATPAPPTAQMAIDVREEDEDEDTGFDYAPTPAPLPPAVEAGGGGVTGKPVPDAVDHGPALFALELETQRLRRELGALKAALGVQQEEIGALHAQIAGLEQRVQIEPPPVVAPEPAQSASPEYSEALVLARRGMSVDDIAARCGITRSEAELVVSLAAGGQAGGL